MAADALEKSVLESKDKEQLVAIATALGIKAGPRAKKEDIITKILDTVGGPGEAEAPAEKPKRGPGRPPKARPAEDATPGETPDGESPDDTKAPAPAAAPAVILGPDGEPLADWEVDLIRSGEMEIPTAADDDGDDEDDAAGAEGGKRRRRRRKPAGGGAAPAAE